MLCFGILISMETTFKTLNELEITETVLAEYNHLRSELRGSEMLVTREELHEVQKRKDSELVLCMYADSVLAGIAQVTYVCVPKACLGYINAVVVDEAFRGSGLGTVLMEKLHEVAKERWPSITRFSLTSNPARGTQGFYLRLGYRMRTKEANDETVFYVKDVDGFVH